MASGSDMPDDAARGVSRRGLFSAFRTARPVEAEASASREIIRFQPSCVERQGVTCRRCAEACDREAIRFRLMVGGRAEPVLNADLCTGCGECLSCCPVSAISLVPLERAALAAELAGLVHEPARKPA